ncbi:MAG TPA: hypothetical protein PKD86_08220 [Gemmatales bacterium]|nr:hypothetical protein [Gemmatales bacterium]
MSWLMPYLPEPDPLWPAAVIVGAAVVVSILTFWTYRARRLELTVGRALGLWLIRMLALALVCLLLLQPSWVRHTEVKLPAKVVILFDSSKSMTVQDAERNETRWQAAISEWKAALPLVEHLQKDDIQIVPIAFDTRLREFLPEMEPDGDGTAFFAALRQALERHRPAGESEKFLGIVVLTDGHDNVGQPVLDDVLSELAQVPCPVHTIGLGKPGGSELNADLVAEAIHAPQTARIKEILSVRGTISAQQFENQPVEVWLLLNGQEVDEAAFGEGAQQPRKVRVVVRPSATRQTIPIEFPPFKLPDVPGDYRLTLKVKPMPGEMTDTNNEVTTYISLSKEGLSVLFFDKLRLEPKYVRNALGSDERISVLNAYPAEERGPEAVRWRTLMKERIEKGNFDVFVIGDLPAARFQGEGLLEMIAEKVRGGAGLLMIGGQESFGSGGWDKTPLADLLPVDVSVSGQLEGGIGERKEIRFVPTDRGLEHFSLRLDGDTRQNRSWWERMPSLDGGNRLGPLKRGATALVVTPNAETLLAVHQPGTGRVAALAVDTTWLWVRPGSPRGGGPARPGTVSEFREAHLRFWRQMILWLAQQERASKNVRIELSERRLAAGKEQTLRVQARMINPGGTVDESTPVRDAQFNVRVQRPSGVTETLAVVPDGGDDGKNVGQIKKTDEVGEYEVIVSASKGGEDLGEARARFMVYRAMTELERSSPNHDVLERIAKTTGGSHQLHGGLGDLLDTLAKTRAKISEVAEKTPNWREPNDWRQGGLLLLFTALIGCEWVMRRIWGLV